MRSLPTRLIIIFPYTFIVIYSVSSIFTRDISRQIKSNQSDLNKLYYEKHFLPLGSTEVSQFPNASIQNYGAEHARTFFPVKTHIVTYGHPRTATTLLFNMVSVSYFLYILHHQPEKVPSIHLEQWKRENQGKLLSRDKKLFVIKTHVGLEHFKSNNTVVFTTASDKAEATKMKATLEKEGHTVAFIQDLQTLKEVGFEGLIENYVVGYGLSSQDKSELLEYFSSWEKLRQCCGQQMSVRWRNEMMPDRFKVKSIPPHPTCASYVIDIVEQSLMNSRLYSRIEMFPNLHPLNKPSLNDDNLNGTYCSQYNYRVRTEGLNIWGVAGGRPSGRRRKTKNSHAIFLISFGKEAAGSTLVERCVLSLRRRGEWDGYIVVLTDAPTERYLNEWDETVIVMHPHEEHFLSKDGERLKYSKDNMSLKPKRFKTFILDYVDLDSRLDSVKYIYYLDIDILAGNTVYGLFHSLEKTYGISGKKETDELSTLHFFTPLSKEWPLQSGAFIVNRDSSRHCLELWREKIDEMTQSGRGRDQDALRFIYERIESGKEKKCILIRMENENYISFPTPRNFEEIVSSDYTSLIHLSNSLYAKKIEEEAQNSFIHDILQLSEEEKKSGKYGKAVVRINDNT